MKHVLVAEDDTEMRKLVAEALRGEGYRVTEVASGNALLGHLHTSLSFGVPDAPDLVVSDVRMPGWNGLEVLAIAQGLACPPMLLITAFGDRETHRLAGELGAAAMIDKPFDIDDLLGRVREILA
ncbi:MAG: response regulator transcription factor [Deltaproteobacteria bacterium]|nr:response regulator transcription factor [Deltaproteobacteria bacterium]